jgi:hypothetical protein
VRTEPLVEVVEIEQCSEGCEHEMAWVSAMYFSPWSSDAIVSTGNISAPVGVFCDERMVLSDVPEFMPIKLFDSFFNLDVLITHLTPESLQDVIWRKAVFTQEGVVVDNGYVAEGMAVRIYHVNGYGEKKVFCGEFTVQKLRTVDNPKPLFHFAGQRMEGAFRFPELTVLVERGTAIADVLEPLNEQERVSAREMQQDFVDVEYTVHRNERNVTHGIFEEGMTLRIDNSAWVQNREETLGRSYDGEDYTDYVVVFI